MSHSQSWDDNNEYECYYIKILNFQWVWNISDINEVRLYVELYDNIPDCCTAAALIVSWDTDNIIYYPQVVGTFWIFWCQWRAQIHCTFYTKLFRVQSQSCTHSPHCWLNTRALQFWHLYYNFWYPCWKCIPVLSHHMTYQSIIFTKRITC